MRLKRLGVGAVVTCGVIVALTGCTHEVLTVPARTEMLGEVHVNQTYAVQVKTEMDPLTASNAQPTVEHWYWRGELPKGEAFERVPFPIYAPGADSSDWMPVWLNEGTMISVSVVDVYKNSHVYIGRIVTGKWRNSHVLLVVPIGDDSLPTLEELQAEDMGYVVRVNSATTRLTTK